jgi:hypothetical protein
MVFWRVMYSNLTDSGSWTVYVPMPDPSLYLPDVSLAALSRPSRASLMMPPHLCPHRIPLTVTVRV